MNCLRKKFFCVIINKHSVLPMLASYMYYVFICPDCNLEERYYDLTTCTLNLLIWQFWYKLSAYENYPSQLSFSVNIHFSDFYCVVASFWLLKSEWKLWVFSQILTSSFYRYLVSFLCIMIFPMCSFIGEACQINTRIWTNLLNFT